MTEVVYHIVEHDGGWAYKVEGSFSETFPTREAAQRAAARAASEQRLPGDTTGIEYEDRDGGWHDEVSSGDDRPETKIDNEDRQLGGRPTSCRLGPGEDPGPSVSR